MHKEEQEKQQEEQQEMGTLDDVEKDEQPLLLETGRAAAISKQVTAKILPIFLLMASLCYLDR